MRASAKSWIASIGAIPATTEAYACAIARAPDRGLPSAALDLVDFAADVAQQTFRVAEGRRTQAKREGAGRSSPSAFVVRSSDVREAALGMLPALTKANRAKG